jgi:NADPH-dependent ferric siderophore reductase
MTQPSYAFNNYRFYDDDANEASATALGTGNNQALDMDVGSANRVQVRIEGVNNNAKAGIEAFSWEYNIDSTGWTTLDGSSVEIQLFQSSYNTHDEDVTQRLTSNSTYDTTNAGCINSTSDPVTSSNIDASNYFELVATIFLVTGQFTGGENIELRIVEGSGDTCTMNVYPTINVNTPPLVVSPSPVNTISSSVAPTVVLGDTTATPTPVSAICNKVDPTVIAGAQGLNQVSFRFRDDTTALNTDGGWVAAININPTLDMGTLYRFRVELEETLDTGAANTYKLQHKVGAGSWTDCGSQTTTPNSAILSMESSQFADDAAVTSALLGQSSETFGNGVACADDATTSSLTIDKTSTETEFAFIIMRRYDNFQELADSETIQLRIVESDGTVLDNYIETPTITVNYPTGFIGGCFVESPHSLGPIEDEGNLYYFAEHTSTASPTNNNRLIALKSTDGGDTWSEVDGSNRPTTADIESADIQFDAASSEVHIFIHHGTSVRYNVFRTSGHASGDTWGTTDEAIVTGITCTDQAVAGVVLSSGDRWCFYRETVSSYERISYKQYTSSAWQSANNLDSTATTNFTWVAVCVGESNLTHVFYQEITNGSGFIYHKSLSSGGSLSGAETISSASGTNNNNSKGIAKPIYWDDTGDEKILVVYRESDNDTWERVITNDGTPGSAVAVTDVGVNRAEGGSNMASMQLTPEGSSGDARLIYSDLSTEDLQMATRSSGSWGTDEEILDAATIDFQQIGVFTHSAGNGGDTVAGIIYQNAIPTAAAGDDGLMWYTEDVITAGGGVTVTPSPVSCIASKVDPTIVMDLTVSPSPISAVARSVLPIKYLQDTFDDNSIDSQLWSEGAASGGDPAVTIAETSQRFEIQPLDNTSGTHYNGIYSNHVYDIAGYRVYSRCDQAADVALQYSTNAVTVQEWPRNEQNIISVWVTGNGTIEFGYKDAAGGWNTAGSISYNPTTHRWHGIRVDATNVYWETSPDGRNWTTRRTVARSAMDIDVTNVHAHIWAGTWGTVASPSAMVTDNFNIIPSVAVTPSASSAICSSVDPTVVLGDTTATPTASSSIASSVDPTVVEGGPVVVEPSPVNCISSSINPTVVLGDTTATPSSVSSIATKVDPVVVYGSLSLSPTFVSSIASKVDPTVVLGDITITPTSIFAIASSVDPTVINNVTLTPTSIFTIASSVDPTVVLGDTTFSPTPVSTIANKVDPTVELGSTIATPSPVSGIAASINPTTVLGSTTATPAPLSAIANKVDPVVVHGSISISPSATSVISSSVNPTVTLGSTIATPSAVGAIAVSIDPFVIGGGVTVAPGAINAVAGKVDPTVVLSSTTATPGPINAITSSVDPTVVYGSLTLSPSFGFAIADKADPTVVYGSLSITPAPASVITSTINPLDVFPAPINAITSTVNPTVIYGDVVISPTPVGVVGDRAGPAVVLGDTTATPTPVSAIARKVDPTVLEGAVVISPSPVNCISSSVNPTVVLGSISYTPTSVFSIVSSVNPTIILGSLTLSPSFGYAIASSVDPTVINNVTLTPAFGYSRASSLGPIIFLGEQAYHPDSDDLVAQWLNEAGLGTNLYQSIDEVIPSDADYIKSPEDPGSSIYRATLEDANDPNTDHGHKVKYRYRKEPDTGVTNMKIRLKEGVTTIAEWTHTNVSTSWTDGEGTLTSGEADSIVDYADLLIEIEAY